MSRKIHVIGNWKMNHNVQSGAEFWTGLSASVSDDRAVFGIAAPAPLLAQAVNHSPDTCRIYGQNCHQAESGAYTGETSANLLKSLGCAGVVLGHSERREYFSESDSLILDKMNRAMASGLQVIYCCGESLEIRKAGQHISHVKKQLQDSVFKLQTDQLDQLVIAYEPIWAIGTGETASSSQAEEMCREIREAVALVFGQDRADEMIVLYGGSVKPANAQEIFAQPNVDGGLVGGASLNPDSFSELVSIAQLAG